MSAHRNLFVVSATEHTANTTHFGAQSNTNKWQLVISVAKRTPPPHPRLIHHATVEGQSLKHALKDVSSQEGFALTQWPAVSPSSSHV